MLSMLIEKCDRSVTLYKGPESSVAAAWLGLALRAAQGVSRSAAARLRLELAPEQLSPAKFGNNCLRLRLDLATHNSTSTATQGIYGGQ